MIVSQLMDSKILKEGSNYQLHHAQMQMDENWWSHDAKSGSNFIHISFSLSVQSNIKKISKVQQKT